MNFATLVDNELQQARVAHAALHSAHEGLAVIQEEVFELQMEVYKRRAARSNEAMLKELVQVGAMAQRMAEDLDLIEY